MGDIGKFILGLKLIYGILHYWPFRCVCESLCIRMEYARCACTVWAAVVVV